MSSYWRNAVANTKQAKKRIRQADKHHQHNVSLRSMLRTYIKNVRSAIESKNTEEAKKSFQIAVPVIDRMAQKNIIHKNTAARYKSRLNKHIKNLVLNINPA